MTQDDVPAAKRREWQQWARNEFGENEQVVEVATKAVLEALVEGHSIDDAMNISRSAAAAELANLSVTAPTIRSDSQKGVAQRPISDPAHLRGLVSSFRQRNELMDGQYGMVWDFRVDSWDRQGRAQPPVAVEMRGLHFTGSVGDGDWIEIESQWKPGEVLPVSSLLNISQNSIVTVSIPSRAKSPGGRARSPVANILLVIVVFVFGVIALKIIAALQNYH
jgi:hypothetical protein